MEAQPHSKGLPRYERILYVTDGSSAALEAGKHAVFLAQRAHAELIVLYAVPDPITRRLSFLLRRVLGEERRIAKQAVEEIVALAVASGVKAISALESGRRSEVLRRAAIRFDVDLIVVNCPRGNDLQGIFGQGHGGAVPLWALRPVCVIMCKEAAQ